MTMRHQRSASVAKISSFVKPTEHMSVPIDIEKQFAYWVAGSDEDIAAAKSLVEKGHLRHGFFFAELALEKALKALVVRTTRDYPPRTHDLLHLAQLAKVALSEEQKRFLARCQQYCFEGRYPGYEPPMASRFEADRLVKEAEEGVLWLKNLSKQ